MDPIYQQLAELLERKERLAFAVLVETKGSTPQKCGAKAIFLPDGRILGTLGGGCLEAETRQKALRAIETGESFSFRAVLDDDFGWDDGLICGGSVQTFVQPDPGRSKVWEPLLAEPSKRQRRVLATITSGDHVGKRALFADKELIVADDLPADLFSELSAKCVKLLAEPEPEPLSLTLEPSLLSVYFEPILPHPILVVCGGGHIGCAVGKIAAWSGFDVVAVDDRASFANKERFPDAKQIIVDDPAKVMKDFPVDADTYICIVTRGHKHDAVILKEIIHKPAAYIGMIGSKRKVRTVMEGFIEEGVATAEDFRRIRTPMGLAIHSLTVEEIAVSVLAELIAVRRNAQNYVALSVTNQLADKSVLPSSESSGEPAVPRDKVLRMNVAIILAAGESRRMGQPKQLLPFGDKTMLECVIDAFETPRVDEIRVVLGYKADEIAAKIAHTSCKIVKNDRYPLGMFTSMQAGLRDLPKKTKIMLLAICDQPRLKRATVEMLIEEFEKKRHKILIPSYNGRQGHPPLLRAEYAKEILAMDESMTLKHFYAEHADDITRLVVEDEGVLIDIDDRETYERELKKLR